MNLDHTSSYAPPGRASVLLSVSDWMTRNGIQRSLKNAGHQVYLADSGTKAVTERKPTLGLISTDEASPIGTDPAVSLCTSHEVPVIWLSTTGAWERPLHHFSIRTVGMLVHPVHESQLLSAVAVALTLVAHGDVRLSSAVDRDGSSSHPITLTQLEGIVDSLGTRPLTRRQSEIVLMLLDGERVPTIAERFGVEPSSRASPPPPHLREAHRPFAGPAREAHSERLPVLITSEVARCAASSLPFTCPPRPGIWRVDSSTPDSRFHSSEPG